jgi:hypothetical protein
VAEKRTFEALLVRVTFGQQRHRLRVERDELPRPVGHVGDEVLAPDLAVEDRGDFQRPDLLRLVERYKLGAEAEERVEALAACEVAWRRSRRAPNGWNRGVGIVRGRRYKRAPPC